MTGGAEASVRSTTSGPAVPALLVATVLWGGTYVVTRSALDDVGVATLLLARLALAAAALWPFARAAGARPRDVFDPRLMAFGLTGMVLHLGLEIAGLEFTSPASAALIIASAPAITAAFAVGFLHERVNRLQKAGIALSVAGAVLVTGARLEGGYPHAWLGNLLVLAGVVAWGVYTVQGRRMPVDRPWQVTTAAATAAAALMVAPLAAVEIAVTGAPSFTPGAIGAIVYLGLAASGIAYGLWNLALRHVGGAVAGAYINLVPVVGVALAVALGDSITPVQAAGGLTVMAGVWVNYAAARGTP